MAISVLMDLAQSIGHQEKCLLVCMPDLSPPNQVSMTRPHNGGQPPEWLSQRKEEVKLNSSDISIVMETVCIRGCLNPALFFHCFK